MYRCNLSLFVEDTEGNTVAERAGEIILAAPPAIGHKIDLTNRNLADADGLRESTFVTIEQIYHSPQADTEAYEPSTGLPLHLFCRQQ